MMLSYSLEWQLLLLCLSPILLVTSADFAQQDKPKAAQKVWLAGTDSLKAESLTVATENNTVSNITVQLGGTAFLHCRVRSLAERTVTNNEHVSWVRKRDWHILSSGMFTFTNDERFQVLRPEGSDDWTLQIKYVQKRDNGTYACQVASGNGIVSHFVKLQIVVPEAYIQGAGDHYVDVGSILSLICVIQKSPTPPQYVFWYHNDEMINYDTSRGGINVETVPGPQTHSKLTIRDTRDADSGNYTCSASNTEPASVYVLVSEGDKMAAIQRRKTNQASELPALFSLSHLLIVFHILR